MHLLSYEIQNIIRRNNVPLRERGKMVELLVAEAIALKISLPSSPVSNPGAHFRTQHKVRVLDMLAKINEEVVIDLDRTCDLAMAIWLSRYRLVHSPNDIRVGRFMAHVLAADENNSIPGMYKDLARSFPDAFLDRRRIEEENDLNDNVEVKGAMAYVDDQE